MKAQSIYRNGWRSTGHQTASEASTEQRQAPPSCAPAFAEGDDATPWIRLLNPVDQAEMSVGFSGSTQAIPAGHL